MKRVSMLALIAILATTPALAETAIQVPDIPSMTEEETADLLTQLAVASVVAQNCDRFAISDAEAELLTASAGVLTARFEMDPAQYNEFFLHPAYDVLNRDDGCAEEGPSVSRLILKLIAWGGSVTP